MSGMRMHPYDAVLSGLIDYVRETTAFGVYCPAADISSAELRVQVLKRKLDVEQTLLVRLETAMPEPAVIIDGADLETVPFNEINAYWLLVGLDNVDDVVYHFTHRDSPDDLPVGAIMMSLVVDGAVRCAAIVEAAGPPFWQYGLSATGGVVFQTETSSTRFDNLERLIALTDGTVELLGDSATYGVGLQALIQHFPSGQHRRSPDPCLGISAGELLVDTATLLIQGPSVDRPGVVAPSWALFQATGMVGLRAVEEDGVTVLQEFRPELQLLPVNRDYCVVWIHGSRVDQLGSLIPVRRVP